MFETCSTDLAGGYGTGLDMRENWTFHSDSAVNALPRRHFAFLCPYG